MSELGEALAKVTGVLERHEVPYMVIGGLAAVAWGEPRTTRDVDVTVDIDAIGTDRFVELASECGEVLPADPVAFAERARVLPIRTDSGIPVDFVLATLPFERDAIARARILTVEGTPVPFCGPEDLILHKIVSERARDHEDVVGILRRQRDAIDLTRLDETIAGLSADLADPTIAERFGAARSAAAIDEEG